MFKSLVPGLFRRGLRAWIDRRAFERKLRRATPVLVYQMSKVASLAVHSALGRQYSGVSVHTHSFAPEHRDPLVRRMHRWAVVERRPLNVISLTREPVSRNVSSFFQCFEEETGVPYADAKFTIEELRSIFLAKFRHRHALEWFDKHILANFGIDVFADPFPADGHATYERGNIRLLLLRSEIEDAVKAQAVREFLGLPEFQLRRANVGDEKEYAEMYKAFKSQVKLPPEYIDSLCGSKYFEHFYNAETLASVRTRWLA